MDAFENTPDGGLYDVFDRTIEDVLESTPKGVSTYALTDLHKDSQGSTFEFALINALEVALELHLWLCLVGAVADVQKCKTLFIKW